MSATDATAAATAAAAAAAATSPAEVVENSTDASKTDNANKTSEHAHEPSALEQSVMAFAAANPVDGKQLMERIAEIQRQLKQANEAKVVLENQSLDAELIRNSMEQLLRHLTPEASKQYLVDEKINDQLLSKKPGVRENALLRMVAACNSTFMNTATIGSKPAARASSEPETAAPKRKRTAEPVVAAAPVQMPPLASNATGDAEMLRQALAAQYNC